MVVIIIMLILTAGTFSYSNQRRQVDFNDAVLKISTLIKTARNYAVTSKSTYDICQTEDDKKTYVPAEGYGVYISRNPETLEARFVLFANIKADSEITKNQYDEVLNSSCVSDLIEEEFRMNGKAAFTGIFADLAGTPLKNYVGDDVNELVIIYRTAMADTTIAANDHPFTVEEMTQPVDIYMAFERPAGGADVPQNIIHVSRLAGFPEILLP